jgi:hypothetical protein
MTAVLDQGAQCFVIHCDSCPEHIETDHVDFTAALEAAKKVGWRAYKGPDGEWAHSCPACTADFAEDNRKKRK